MESKIKKHSIFPASYPPSSELRAPSSPIIGVLKDFYRIENIHTDEEGLKATVSFNPEHWIYKAHFPGNPITPGVCLLQICRDLLSVGTGTEWRLKRANNIKFLHILDPEKQDRVVFSFRNTLLEDGIKTTADIRSGELCFVKVSAEYIPKNH